MTITYTPKKLQKHAIITTIPGDKSISHRAIILSSLAKNHSMFTNFLCAKDCLNTVEIFQKLGVPITVNSESQTVEVIGQGYQGLKKPNSQLYVGNSGTGIRLITGLLAGQPFDTTITGDTSIEKRPMKRIIDPLTQMGASITGTNQNNDSYPPLNITAKSLKSIHYTLPIASAQVKSAILFASLFAEGQTQITEPIACRNHSEVMLQTYGANIKIQNKTIYCDGEAPLNNPHSTPITIPSDFSSAAFFIVLGLITPNTSFTLTNIGLNPTRAKLLDILKKMGANLIINTKKDGIEPYGDITIQHSSLKNIAIDPNDIAFIIDEIPILAVAGMFGTGKLIITDAKELRYKESDRIKSTVEMIKQFGGKITENPDGFILEGQFKPKKPFIKTYYDHRIAMSALIAATASGQTIDCDDISAIETSFPQFLTILNQLQNR